MIWVRYTVLFSKFTSIPPLLKNSLAAHLNSASITWGEKNLTMGLDLVPLQSPKWTIGFTLAQASCILLDKVHCHAMFYFLMADECSKFYFLPINSLEVNSLRNSLFELMMSYIVKILGNMKNTSHLPVCGCLQRQMASLGNTEVCDCF